MLQLVLALDSSQHFPRLSTSPKTWKMIDFSASPFWVLRSGDTYQSSALKWGYRASKSGQGVPQWYRGQEICSVRLSFPVSLWTGIQHVRFECYIYIWSKAMARQCIYIWPGSKLMKQEWDIHIQINRSHTGKKRSIGIKMRERFLSSG